MTSLQRFLRRIGIKLAQFTAIQVEVLCSMIIWQDLKIYVVWKPYDVFFSKRKVFRRYRWVHRRAGRTTCSRRIGEASLRHNQLHEVFLPYLPRGDTIAHKNPIIHHIALLCFFHISNVGHSTILQISTRDK